MGFDLEKRVANELNRLEDEVAHRPDITPSKRFEQFRRIAEELKQRMLGNEVAEQAPGKRTQIDELFSASIARMTETASRAQQQLGQLPWQNGSKLDDYRAAGLQQVVSALGRERVRLQRATLGAAEPEIAARVNPGKQPRATQAGQAMWRVAERRAATLYRHAMDAGDVASEDPIVDEALAKMGSGTPLPTPLRKQMEADLGISLARVRVHTDSVAAQAAKAVRADAFTVGEDIFFAAGQFSPDSREGQKLLAHELTHVVQAYQGRTNTGGTGIAVSQPGEALEREADAMAERIERRTARRAAKAEQPGRIRFESSRTAAARGSAPTMAAPVISQPSAKQAATLLRRASNETPADENRARQPRDQQNPDKRGTQPKLETKRDHQHEKSVQHTQKGTKPDVSGAAKSATSQLKGAVSDLKQQVKKATKKKVSGPAKAAAHGEATKHKNTKKAAKAVAKAAKAHKHDHDHANGHHSNEGKSHGGDAGHSGGVKFKQIGDWQKYMPEDLPDTDEREKAKILELVKKKINHDRAKSAEMLGKLASAQKAEAASVRAMGPALVATIKGAQAAAVGKVSSAESAQTAAVQAAVSGQQAAVRAHAAAMVGQITSAHSATVAAIHNNERSAKQALTVAKTSALTAIATARAAQHVTVSVEYMIATGRMVAIGAQKAAEALALPSSISLPYDGDKLEAAEKAAKEVAAKYAEAMPEKAQEAANELKSTKGQVDQQVDQMADNVRDAINNIFEQAKQALEDATRQAEEAAETLKTQSIAQVNQTSSSTCSQLAAHGASQVAAIRSAAAGARSAITTAGATAATNVQSAVSKAASGIATGAQGLIKGALQIEAPDPHTTHQQVTEAARSLKQGAQQLVGGLRQQASGAAQNLNQQAQGAASGMAQTAEQAKAAAQQMGAGANQAMTGIASGASQGLKAVEDGHKEQSTKIADGGKTAFKERSDALKADYEKLRSTLHNKLDEMCNNARTQFSQAVPTDERAAILENAKKAADAVKPWWQKALAFVVKIVVAVAITIAVGALIGATGGLGLVAVGLLAGALSTVGGQMAENLVLGEPLMKDITVRSVLAGAIGGAVTAGFGAGLQSGLSAFGGATGKSIATTLATKGSAGIGGALLRTGAGVAGDVVGDAASQFVATGHYEFSMTSLVQSVVMNGVTQTGRYGSFEESLQRGIRSKVPSIDISTGHGNSPMGARPDGETGSYFNASGNRAGDLGKMTPQAGHGSTPPGGSAPEGGTGSQSAGRGGETGAQTQTQQHAGGDTTTTNRGTGGAGEQTPTNTAHAGGDTTATNRGTGGAGEQAATNRGTGGAGEPTTTAHAGAGEPTTTNRGTGGAGEQQTTSNRRTGNAGEQHTTAGAGDQTTTNRGTGGAGEQTTARGTNEPHGGDTHATGETNARTGAHGEADATTGKQGSARRGGAGEGEAKRTSAGGDEHDTAHATGGDHDGHRGTPERQGAHPTGDEGGATPHDGAEASNAGELADMGYPNATRAAGDQAAEAIASGRRPGQESVRETEANQRGLADLQKVDADPHLTPDQKAAVREEVSGKMRGEEPTGNLERDVADAKQRQQQQEQTQTQGDGQTPGKDGETPGAQRPAAMSDENFAKLSPQEKMNLAGQEIQGGARVFDSQEAAAQWARDTLHNNVDALPHHQKQSIHNYTNEPGNKGHTGPTYQEMNGLLRDQAAGRTSRHDTPEVRRDIAHVDEAMAANRLPEAVTVVRGSGKGHLKVSHPQELVGTTMSEPGYLSTSLGDNGPVAAFSGKEMIIHLQVPEGHQALWVEPVGAFGGGERELLLGRGTSWTVTRAFETPDGKWHVYGRVN